MGTAGWSISHFNWPTLRPPPFGDRVRLGKQGTNRLVTNRVVLRGRTSRLAAQLAGNYVSRLREWVRRSPTVATRPRECREPGRSTANHPLRRARPRHRCAGRIGVVAGVGARAAGKGGSPHGFVQRWHGLRRGIGLRFSSRMPCSIWKLQEAGNFVAPPRKSFILSGSSPKEVNALRNRNAVTILGSPGSQDQGAQLKARLPMKGRWKTHALSFLREGDQLNGKG